MKVVLDSNIYVSAFAFDRGPEKIINCGIAGHFRLYSSLYIIDEVKRVLHRLGTSERFAFLAGARIARFSMVVVPVRGAVSHDPIPIDPKDGPIIKTCRACRADFLVTGDKLLLAMRLRGLEVINATAFLRHLRNQGIKVR